MQRTARILPRLLAHADSARKIGSHDEARAFYEKFRALGGRLSPDASSYVRQGTRPAPEKKSGDGKGSRLYADILWPRVRDELLFRAKYGGFHGSEVRDVILREYPNAGASLDRADTLLRELEESGDLERHEKPTPTPTQAAINGLAYSRQGYKDMVGRGMLTGLREHFFYEGRKREAA